MAISSVGTPLAATSTTITSNVVTVAGTWNQSGGAANQNRTAGNLLVAVITFNATTSAAATAQAAGTTGWTNILEIGSAATALARTAFWVKTAAGADAAPSFTSNVAASASALGSCTLYELSGADNGLIFETTGTNAVASGSVAAQTATTSGNVAGAGAFGIAGFARERASIASTITASGSYALDTSNTTVTSIGHFATMSLAGPAKGSTSAATVNYSSTATSSAAAGAVVVFAAAQSAGPAFSPFRQAVRAQPVKRGIPGPGALAGLVYGSLARPGAAGSSGSGRVSWSSGAPVNNPVSGPRLGWGNPAGVRGVLLRTGNAMATQVPAAPPLPPVVTGPPFYPAVQAVRARLPQPPAGMGAMRGRHASSPPASVRNPVPGPVFTQKAWPVQAQDPLPRRGRTASNRGGPVQNPVPSGTGPVFYPFRSPVRAHPAPPRRGRMSALWGAPVQNPAAGPVFTQAASPVRARTPLPRRGRVYSTAKPPAAVVPPPSAPPFRPAVQAVRARLPQPHPGLIHASVPPASVSSPAGATTFNTGTSAATAGGGPAANIQLTIPAGVLAGDAVIVTACGFDGALGATLSASSTGTTPILADQVQTAIHSGLYSNGGAWYFTASGTDAGKVITITCSSGNVYWGASLAAYTGASNSTPVDVHGATSAVGTAITVTCPGETTGAAGDWAVYLTASGITNTHSAVGPAGSTQRENQFASGIGTAIFDSNGSVGGAGTPIGGGTFSETGTSDDWWTAFTVGLAPAAVSVSVAPSSYAPYFSTGRVSFSYGAAAQNPVTGPVFRPAVHPAQARTPLPPRGRVSSNPGGPVQNPVPGVAGPPFFPFRSPVRVHPALPPRGRTASSPGAPVRNPASGPAFRQLPRPVQAADPLPKRGRVTSNPGGPVQNPAPGFTGPVFYPRNSAKAQLPLPRRGTCRAIRFGPLPANPSQGPVFTQATSPARARIPQPFSRGRASGSAGAPVQNPPGPGPVFRQATVPARIRPSLPPRGRTASNPGGPVQNPPPPILGPAFRQATSPARIRPGLPPRGRVSANPGAPVRNPHAGPAVYAPRGPVRAPVPQVFSRGRVSANPGGPVVFPAVPAPVYPAHGPVRIRPSLPPRGRTAGNAGIPVAPAPVPAPVYPLHGPVQARRPLPPRGRAITGNPGAPVRNPHQGAVFHSLPWPARTRIPQNAPRGRTSSNPGGPVANIPFTTLLFRLGSPYFQWETETPGLTSEWSTGTPVFAWAAGVPETSA